MEIIVNALIDYGYWGMFVAAFIAGSVFPFSSETVMVGLQLAGLAPWPLFLSATIGNVAGSMFNYGIGRLGKIEWIEKYLHIKRRKVERTQRFMQNRGAWMGVLCFLPILGSVIAVTLGYMRANPWVSFISITIGKAVRYAILVWLVALL